MNQDKLHLINKIFNNETIRTIWDKNEEKYYISIVDIVAVLTESKNPTTYWRVLKKRLKDEGNQTVTNCNGLKLKAKDGKYRITDVCDIEEKRKKANIAKNSSQTQKNTIKYHQKNKKREEVEK